jgi:ketosteroid isomerase-like protein
MKNQVLKGICLICVLSFIIACSPKKEETTALVVDKEQIKKEIQAKEDELAATYNAREVRSIGYYADDAITYRQNKAPLVGKETIVEFIKTDILTFPISYKISFVTNEIYVSDSGNQVLEIGYYKVVDSVSNPVNTGNYMSLFVKRDGKYVCLRDMSVSDIPNE